MTHKAPQVRKVPVSAVSGSSNMPLWLNALFQSLFGMREGRVRPGDCRVRKTCKIPVCYCRNLEKCRMEGRVD